MKHLMIDLETMDNKPTAAITSIGAVFFNPETGEMGATFYRNIMLESSVAHGCTIGAETVLWWMQQEPEASRAWLYGGSQDLRDVIEDLLTFINNNCDSHTLQVWGKGPSFDNVILRHAVEKCGYRFPFWNFWNDRDVRTVEQLAKDLGLNINKVIRFEGIPHHALDDAIHQVKIVSYVWMYLVKIASVK